MFENFIRDERTITRILKNIITSVSRDVYKWWAFDNLFLESEEERWRDEEERDQRITNTFSCTTDDMHDTKT